MTEETMKSDYIIDSKSRSEGRTSLPRRRVAPKKCNDIGDFELELSLAIRESLKYAKEREGQLKQVNKTSPVLVGVQSDESFSGMAGKVSNLDQSQNFEEIRRLKDLLLMHIELIEHQQEVLTNKDKEIRTLRDEKETLQYRLHKVEKRVTQMKQREDLLEVQIANLCAKDTADAQSMVSHAGPQERNKVLKSEQGPRRRRRRHRWTRVRIPHKVRKHTRESDKASESVISVEQEDSNTEDSEDTEDEEDYDEVDNGAEEGEQSTEDQEQGLDCKKRERVETDPHPEPVLRTNILYHVSCCLEPEEEPDDLMDIQEETISSGEKVEIPGWRINVVANRYQLEGTENITDEAYENRHQKHETEEKKRKKWDIQRLREQQVLEKLRGKQETSTSPSESCQSFKTFLPSIEDLTHIEILDTVPVMAFGRAVPHVQPSEFELPWDANTFLDDTRKSHGGRGRQK